MSFNFKDFIAAKQDKAPTITRAEWDLLGHKNKDWTMENSPNGKPITFVIINGEKKIIKVKGINV